jgi:Photosynthesis system II assembly factor YCF48/Putative zinc-finger
MEPLPKIARERLQASAASDHPDADLLTAFAEHALPERERSQVADHLSRCLDCRQVLVLSSPEVGAALSPALQSKLIPQPRPGLFSWPVLRWGALAACVVVISAAGLLLTQHTSHKYAQTAKAPEPEKIQVPTEELSRNVPSAITTPSSVPGAPEQTLDLYAKQDLRAFSNTPPAVANRKKFLTLPEERASKTADTLLALSPGFEVKREAEKPSIAAAGAAPSRADADQSSTAQAVPATPQPLAKDRIAADEKVEYQPSNKEDVRNQVGIVSETVEVTAPAPTLQTETASVASNAAPKKTRDEAESKAALAGRRVSNELAATAATTSGRLLMRDVSSAKWTLSPDGLPQRSFDSGKTWEKMQVDHHTGFRALSAQGMDVWVGGLAGALYHSSDVGMHWTRIIPATANTSLTSDIITMNFRDPLRGTLTTANQETWSTSDGGKTWQKE